jgi:hypothetical protein
VIKAQYAAGYTEGDYEMVTGSDQNAVNLAVTGCLADLAQYGEIDLNGPYWEQVYIEKNTFAGSLYSLLGDYSLTANLSVSSICFNKKLMIEQGHKEPYDLVRTYEWTVEKMLSYMEGFARDNDGDGTFNYDMDCFSLSGNGPESVYGIFYGSGFTFCTNDGEQCEFDYNMTLLGEILDRTVDVWCQRGVYLNNSSQEIMKQLTLEIFSSGRGLFCDVPLYKIGESFGEMEDDYGILPEPMFTKEQGTYYSYVYRNVPILLVPANDPNPERTGNIIETVCAASSDIVIDNVFDIVTKTRNVRDPDSAEMIDIIIENKVFDVAHWLDLAGYGTLSAMVVKEKNPDIFVSYINMYKNKAENDLNNYIEAYKKFQKN